MSTTNNSQPSLLSQLLQVPVIVAALGYLVDMYDLFLFSVVRVPSLKALNVPDDQLLTEGISLLNYQMAGMLIGGVLWGVIADKRGRLSVLFGSIIMYSLANIGNGFVTSLDQYAVLRFIAGVGLAGELGAGITLVTEVLPKEIRGYGTTLVATLGVLGAILAYFVADLFAWRISYFVGGGMGLLLLVLRFNVFESGMFKHAKERSVDRGNIMMILLNGKRLGKYLMAIIVGLPIWFVVGILITFSPEFGSAKGIEGINAGKAVMLAFSGQVGGDIVSGLLSQYMRSRKKVIRLFIILSLAMVVGYLLIPMQDLFSFYLLCTLLGFCNGYWTLFITIAAELFGTNLRATVATTVPNFVRGATIPLAALFVSFRPDLGVIQSGLVIGVATAVIALLALYFLEETFTKDMDFVEKE
ncbi:MFS transporter [Dyadobacter fermentans]|uniref:Major facilitator superfamily MFS_1 n=1 Tax=Dyadobacter fermentans (strain ATCC 700827 / DSM 18053 / CIP 107007 / KCTC 52180 / NS114) TaxID=471854 RepID=C6W4Y4_DYAFD|nr:MFS transporter [Dyadobacter fermentans]ACT95958.1 major facilitator superfamily MFS_1 [Dyadobacter fermentans DSM 18053]